MKRHTLQVLMRPAPTAAPLHVSARLLARISHKMSADAALELARSDADWRCFGRSN